MSDRMNAQNRMNSPGIQKWRALMMGEGDVHAGFGVVVVVKQDVLGRFFAVAGL